MLKHSLKVTPWDLQRAGTLASYIGKNTKYLNLQIFPFWGTVNLFLSKNLIIDFTIKEGLVISVTKSPHISKTGQSESKFWLMSAKQWWQFTEHLCKEIWQEL